MKYTKCEATLTSVKIKSKYKTFIHRNASENILCEMEAIWSMGEMRVKPVRMPLKSYVLRTPHRFAHFK